MANGQEGQNALKAGMELLSSLSKLPAPDKVYYELQRLNNNLEKVQPDLTKLARSLDNINPSDLRALTTALQGLKPGEMMLVITEANSTMKALYERIWGKK
jgi:hypothetical protein